MVHLMMVPRVLAAAQASPTMWYFTRALAVAAYVALAVTVMLGILRSLARRTSERLSWVVDEIHQYVATLAAVLVAGHLVTLLLDSFLPFSLRNLFIPLNEPYRPLATNLGVFSFYSLVVVWLSSWAKQSLSYGFWRALHYVSFVSFVLITLHGWLGGSDSKEPFMRGIYVGCSAAIAFLTLMRLFAAPRRQAVATPQATRV
jgi:predicted ferric reductase